MTRAEANKLYGNPELNGKLNPQFEKDNIVTFVPPFVMRYDYDLKIQIKSFRIHKKAVPSLTNIYKQIWNACRLKVKEQYPNKTTAEYDVLTLRYIRNNGFDRFGGSFVFRTSRNSNSLSAHAYGLAIDLYPSKNPMGKTLITTFPDWFVKIWTGNGWTWGGLWKSTKDSMHFSFAGF